MEKFYTEELLNEQFNPHDETISFLLNYSKSIKIVKDSNQKQITLHLN